MLRLIIIIFLGGIVHPSICQHHFLFERKSLKEIRILENAFSSKYLGFIETHVSDNYFPSAKANKDYYPLTYIRTNDSFFPSLHVEYFYNDSDSTLLATSYDWNIMDYIKNFKTDGDKLEKEKKRKKEYLEKYNSIKNELITKFGPPILTEEKKDREGYFYKLRWENETQDILLLLKFSTKLKKLPEKIRAGSYNIRVKVDYK